MNRNPAAYLILLAMLAACSQREEQTAPAPATDAGTTSATTEQAAQPDEPFEVVADRFADLRVLRYRVPGFEELDLRTKTLLYYLYNAALSGREIYIDQKYRYNLAIMRTLEAIVRAYPGPRDTGDFDALMLYAKRVWFSNGIHHHYSHDKFAPGFSFAAFEEYVKSTPADFPTRPDQSLDEFLAELRPIMFDRSVDAKLVNKREGIDVVAASAVNFYSGVTQAEAEAFYEARRDPNDPTPPLPGLNSRLVKTASGVEEQVWKVGGLYTEAIEEIVVWLERAVDVAENDAQREALEKLIAYYRSGDLEDWDEYNIAWVEDSGSTVDTINGFIEVYDDPIGLRGAWEAVVQVIDPVATRRIETLAREAQWFEDNSPILDEHKKDAVTGITGRVINVVVEAGDSSPASPVGINLPNSAWIRQQHGSKSVSLANIVLANDLARGGAEEEFAWDAAELARADAYGEVTDQLATDMHEVIGHASGKLNPGVPGVNDSLGIYGSAIEEARADLVSLYFMLDPKLVELGLLPTADAGYIRYDRYIRNGLMQQLNRIEPGQTIEEDHMRNRQLVASWAYEQGLPDNVVERLTRDGKTYFRINDYRALRNLFGRLLRELQRIKSEGDFEAARDLIETYGVRVDPEIHAEVLERYAALDIAPYSGFINPKLVPVEENGRIVDVEIEYPGDFVEQMLEYADDYRLLPTWNF
jgi:dipeptidyl-peptidase-3